MRKVSRSLALAPLAVFLCLSQAPPGWAQQANAQPARAATCTVAEQAISSQGVSSGIQVVPALPVPRLVKFTGVAKDASGQPHTGVVGLTFAIYAEQEGGATLWMETQNAELDVHGRYSVLLGSTQSEGMPLDLFATGDARWLGVQIQLPGEAEQPRVLLVSVPYALKAADAESLGGKPAAAYALAPGSATGTSSSSGAGRTATSNAAGVITGATIGGSGALNQVTKFTPDGMTIGNSSIAEVGGNVGVGVAPQANQRLAIAVPAGELALNMSNLADQDLIVSVTSPGAANKLGIIGPTTPTNLALQVGGTEKVRVTNAGNVGIGVIPPANQRLAIGVPAGDIALNMSNLADQDLFVSISSPGAADKVGIIGPGQPTNLGLQVGGTEKVRVTNAGNVGIGTKTPTQSLEVAGNVKINGSTGLVFADGSSMASAGTVANLTVTGGVTTVGGLILKSPDGTKCVKANVDNMGNVTFPAVTCP